MVSFDHLGPALLHHFPETRKFSNRYQIELEGPDREGAYIIFGSVLHPYIEEMVATKDIAEVARVMDFIESLANDEDRRWRELVQIEFGEWTVGKPERELLENLAGPETRMAIWRAERWLHQRERDSNASPLISWFRRITLPKKKANKC